MISKVLLLDILESGNYPSSIVGFLVDWWVGRSKADIRRHMYLRRQFWPPARYLGELLSLQKTTHFSNILVTIYPLRIPQTNISYLNPCKYGLYTPWRGAYL